MKSYLGIRGPGILYIKDLAAFLSTPAAQRQLAAVRRLSMTCKCFARCEADCVCDHDWTPPAVIALRTELAMLQEANLALRDELTAADTAMDYERQRLRAELAALQQMYTAQGLTIKRQQDELAEAKRDAERYRWLVEGAYCWPHGAIYSGQQEEGVAMWVKQGVAFAAGSHKETVDAAIDAAMAGGEQ